MVHNNHNKPKYQKNNNRRHHTKRPYNRSSNQGGYKQNRKVRELMDRYKMEESVALEIVSGVLPLDLWLEKQKQKEQQRANVAKFRAKVENFSSQAKFTTPLAIEILKGAFELPEYRQQKFDKMEREKKAHQISLEAQIALPVARSIVDGKYTLKEYLAKQKIKEERRKKAKEMHRKNPNLAIETCYKIVDDGISVDKYLENQEESKKKRGDWYRNYLKDHFEDNKPLHSYLDKLRKNRIPVMVYAFGNESVSGQITAFTPYEIKVKTRRGREINYPKLELKYFCRSIYAEKVLESMEINRKLQTNPVTPNSDRYKRYQFSEKMLQKNQKICITLGEGEEITGKLCWFSKFDLKLMLSSSPKATVMIFCHSIVDVKILSTPT